MVRFQLNGKSVTTEVPDDTPLLWVIREEFGLTGTRYGCGGGYCGCCTVHVDGAATKTCVLPVSAVADKQVTTIEGLASDGALHPVQQAWIEHDVAQCGYCQSGQIMAAAALLAANPRPDDAAIEAGMGGNLCRCGTYHRIRLAVRSAARPVEEDQS